MTPRQPRRPAPAAPAAPLTLQEAAERLDVHYMTAYRYVRTGRLHATRREGTWEVDAAEVERLRAAGSVTRAEPRPARGRPAPGRRIPDLVDRLIAGDEPGAWVVAQAALASGSSPASLYMDLFAPAMRMVGERWERGEVSVADEHCASAVMHRLIGRSGPLFRRRGRTRGIVVLGAPEGELHALPTALAADVLRSHGFVVIDLGADVPTGSFVDCACRLPRVAAVAIAVTLPASREAAGRLVGALREAGLSVPVVVGGAGVDEGEALRLGADRWAGDAAQLAHVLIASR